MTAKLLPKLQKWLSRKWVVIGLISLAAAGLRFWNVDGALQFLGDQGRDAIVVSRIFTEGDFVFIGPVTSIGNMYLGPLYYYWMVPWLVMSYPSPVGPAYAMAFLGTATVFLTYWWGRKLVGHQAAMWASFLLGFSQTAIYFSRFSWNPNPEPLVSLAMIYATYLAWKKHPFWWIGVALAWSILIQLHYMTLLAAGGAGIIWMTQLFEVFKRNSSSKHWRQPFLLSTLTAVAVVLVSLTPLLLFDWKHNWLNARGFWDMATDPGDFPMPPLVRVWQIIRETHGRSMHILTEWLVGSLRGFNTFTVFMTLVVTGFVAATNAKYRSGLLVIFAYLFVGILGTAWYQHSVFDHYISFLFPTTVLLHGVVLNSLTHLNLGKIPLGKIMALTVALGFVWYNFPSLLLRDSNWSIYDQQRVTQSILERVQPGETYNIVLLSETKDLEGQNYRYFLTTSDRPPVTTEHRAEADKLFIINEVYEPEPTKLPVYEIVTFPNKIPAEVYTIDPGPEIMVLSRY